MFNSNKKDFRKLDKLLILSATALIIMGLVVLNSAVHPVGDSIKTQVLATALGFLLFFFIFFLDFNLFRKLKWFIYALIILALAATILFGSGKEQWGANLWIKIGPVSIQPSEFVKLLLILFLGAFVEDNKKNVNKFSFFISYFILALIPVALIIKQEDLGTAMVILFIVSAMFFVSGISTKNIIIILAVLLVLGVIFYFVGLPLVWEKLAPYQQNRILNFIDPSRDTLNTGLQMQRGFTAIGSGQLNGRGYMQGPMAQNSYIPEQHTDYIFPVLVEEFGFVGGASVLILYFIMLLRMIVIATHTTNSFETTVVVGILAMFFIHIFENVGMTMRLMPVTGIPLPFFSNGGTFQIINITSLAIVLTIGAYRKPLDF